MSNSFSDLFFIGEYIINHCRQNFTDYHEKSPDVLSNPFLNHFSNHFIISYLENKSSRKCCRV